MAQHLLAVLDTPRSVSPKSLQMEEYKAPQSLPLERDVVAISAGQRDPQMHFVHMVFHHVLSLAPEVAGDADLKSDCSVLGGGVASLLIPLRGWGIQ